MRFLYFYYISELLGLFHVGLLLVKVMAHELVLDIQFGRLSLGVYLTDHLVDPIFQLLPQNSSVGIFAAVLDHKDYRLFLRRYQSL